MASSKYWIGTTGPFLIDEAEDQQDAGGYLPVGTKQAGVIVEGQIRVLTAPALPEEVLREEDIGGIVGNMSGPGAATDNAVARFDTTTGKLLQNSVVLIGDAGNVTGVTDLTASGDVMLVTGKSLTINSTQVVSDQQAAVADATGAGDVVAQLNDLLAKLRTHGLIDT
jgi:hypothetical protein